MISKNIISALAFSAVASAVPAFRRNDPCQDAWKACIAAGTPEVACSCTLASCLGEDDGREAAYCATATANLSQPAATSTSAAYVSATVIEPVTTSIPGGCNPAHPGSCPDSYFSTTVVTPSQSTDCESEVSAPTSTPAATTVAPPQSTDCESEASTTVATPVATSIPGGCNPAHPGSCPTPSAAVTAYAAGANPTKVEGKTWNMKNLSRYCIDGNTGCDYNFSLDISGKAENCTIVRMPGSNAATESWSNEPCTTESQTSYVSWAYVTEPAPAYAVITITYGKEIAWTGASDVNGQAVTLSNPFGSGQYTVAPAQVFTY